MICINCDKELEQVNSGFDTLQDDDEYTHPEETFVARAYKCNNIKCNFYKKEINVFYDYTRFEVDDRIEHESTLGSK